MQVCTLIFLILFCLQFLAKILEYIGNYIIMGAHKSSCSLKYLWGLYRNSWTIIIAFCQVCAEILVWSELHIYMSIYNCHNCILTDPLIIVHLLYSHNYLTLRSMYNCCMVIITYLRPQLYTYKSMYIHCTLIIHTYRCMYNYCTITILTYKFMYNCCTIMILTGLCIIVVES